jgi:hypothetical protein
MPKVRSRLDRSAVQAELEIGGDGEHESILALRAAETSGIGKGME